MEDTNRLNQKYVVYKDYCTDIGWGKAYYNENDPDDSRYSWGCPKNEATIFYSEGEARIRCNQLNNDDFEENIYRYERIKNKI